MKKMKAMKELIPFFLIWEAIMLIGISVNSQPFNTSYEDLLKHQKGLPDHSWIIHAGLSFPFGSFKSSDWQNDKSGYAQTGFFTGIEGLFPLHHKRTKGGYFTVSGTLGTSFMGNASNFKEKIENIQKPFAEKHFSFNGEIVNFESQSNWWWFFTPFMGIRFDFQNPSLSGIYASVEGGVMIGRLPRKKVDVTVQNEGGREKYEFKKESAVGSGISVNVGGGVVINKKFDLNLHYLYGIPKYPEMTEVMIPMFTEMPTGMIQAGVSIYL